MKNFSPEGSGNCPDPLAVRIRKKKNIKKKWTHQKKIFMRIKKKSIKKNCFDAFYLSQEINLRKPEATIALAIPARE